MHLWPQDGASPALGPHPQAGTWTTSVSLYVPCLTRDTDLPASQPTLGPLTPMGAPAGQMFSLFLSLFSILYPTGPPRLAPHSSSPSRLPTLREQRFVRGLLSAPRCGRWPSPPPL